MNIFKRRKVTKEVDIAHLYSLRWAAQKATPESAGLALKILNHILGDSAPQLPAPTPAPAPEAPKPVKKKPNFRVALCVGHNAEKKGAYSEHLNCSEFTLMDRVADAMIEQSPLAVHIRKFHRKAGRGYSKQIEQVYGEINAFQPDLTLSLHFNGGGGNYCLNLIGKNGSIASERAAAILSDEMAQGLSIPQKPIERRGRDKGGGYELIMCDSPVVLLEPFFGDNQQHCQKIAELGSKGLAELYIRAILRIIHGN